MILIYTLNRSNNMTNYTSSLIGSIYLTGSFIETGRRLVSTAVTVSYLHCILLIYTVYTL